MAATQCASVHIYTLTSGVWFCCNFKEKFFWFSLLFRSNIFQNRLHVHKIAYLETLPIFYLIIETYLRICASCSWFIVPSLILNLQNIYDLIQFYEYHLFGNSKWFNEFIKFIPFLTIYQWNWKSRLWYFAIKLVKLWTKHVHYKFIGFNLLNNKIKHNLLTHKLISANQIRMKWLLLIVFNLLLFIIIYIYINIIYYTYIY